MKDIDTVETNIKRFLKSEMMRRGINSEKLSRLLHESGAEYSRASIDNKICRGKFSATFFLKCLYVMNCDVIEVKDFFCDEK